MYRQFGEYEQFNFTETVLKNRVIQPRIRRFKTVYRPSGPRLLHCSVTATAVHNKKAIHPPRTYQNGERTRQSRHQNNFVQF